MTAAHNKQRSPPRTSTTCGRRRRRSAASPGSVAILPSVATSAHAEILPTEAVDSAYFATIAVGAQLGRVIQPHDDVTAARVAVLSDELWRSRYAADRKVLGQTIRINGQPFEVIGVAPARYRGALGKLRSTRLWIPLASEGSLATASTPSVASMRERPRLVVLGRLAPDITVERASAELAAIASSLNDAHPPRLPAIRGNAVGRKWAARLISDDGDSDSSTRRVGMTVVVLVALVLVVACTNLANLVLARGAARQGELAVRMALGASRGRLIWEQCVESLILAAVGMGASYVMFQVLAAMMTNGSTFGIAAMRATLSIRPVLNAPGAGRCACGHASRDRGIRPGARGAAGAHGRYQERPCGRRQRHQAAAAPSAHGHSLAGCGRCRLLHRRHHVHPRHDSAGAARHRRRNEIAWR